MEKENKNLNEVQDNEIILDIGINTIKKLKKKSINPIQFYGMDLLDILKMLNFSKGTLSNRRKYL